MVILCQALVFILAQLAIMDWVMLIDCALVIVGQVGLDGGAISSQGNV